MPYAAEISRTNPTSFVFLIDRSGSMSNPIGGLPGKTKAEVVADAINRLLQTLVLRCAKSEGVRDYFHVAVIGYGRQVGPALGGALAGRGLVPISEVADNPLRVDERVRKIDDGAGGIVSQSVKFPVWFEPVADGKTPMVDALAEAQGLVSEFLAWFPRCFPPLVLNITDGEANMDPEPAAAALRSLGSDDGNVLLFNLHVSSSPETPVQYPDGEQGLPDDFARRLFRMSSVLPPQARDAARREGLHVGESARGFVFNADLVSVVQFLDIGTRVDRNVR
jgi:hypothetical protein